MNRKTFVVLVSLILVLGFVSATLAQTAAPKDERKHTTLGKYVTAAEAYQMWKANPEKVKVLDCRIPEEYAFVGHAPMAYNVPSKLWTGKWDGEKKDYVLDDNPDFVAQVKKLFALDDTILVMCRSGHRSAPSVNKLAEAGFTNVYNITDGFEGDKVTDEDSYYKGKRMKNGWRNSSAPWTYDIDTTLLYNPAK